MTSAFTIAQHGATQNRSDFARDLIRRQHYATPDGIAYSSAIDACHIGIQWDKAVRLLQMMRSEGIRPDDSTMIKVIMACRECEQQELANQQGCPGCEHACFLLGVVDFQICSTTPSRK
eukprot:Skav206573  [mRNA]  locus=scaffold925:479890:484643:- [translate_table: standard]